MKNVLNGALPFMLLTLMSTKLKSMLINLVAFTTNTLYCNKHEDVQTNQLDNRTSN